MSSYSSSQEENSHLSSSAMSPVQNLQQSNEIKFPTGIANIPNQVHYLASRRHLHLNILAFGEAALGKTSMINSILGQLVFDNNQKEDSTSQGNTRVAQSQKPSFVTEHIRVRSKELDENGVRVNMSLFDMPALGQSLRKQAVHDELLGFVREQHLKWMLSESSTASRTGLWKTSRGTPVEDPRIHVCLYFLNPGSHKLSNVDFDLLGSLSKLCPVIVIIGKADTLLRHELHRIKYNVRDQLKKAGNSINLYPSSAADNELFVCMNGDEQSILNLVHHHQQQQVQGANPAGRSYPWGFVKRTQSNLKLNVIQASCVGNAGNMSTINGHPNYLNQSGINELSSLLFRAYLPQLLAKTEELYEQQRAKVLKDKSQGNSSGNSNATIGELIKQIQELNLAQA